MTATHPGVDLMLAVSSSTYRTDSEANRDGRGGPHREVSVLYRSDRSRRALRRVFLFSKFVNALILFLRAGEHHEKENYDTRHTEDEAERAAHYGPDRV